MNELREIRWSLTQTLGRNVLCGGGLFCFFILFFAGVWRNLREVDWRERERAVLSKYLCQICMPAEDMFGVELLRICAGIDFRLAFAIDTSVCGLKLLVCAVLSYECMRP